MKKKRRNAFKIKYKNIETKDAESGYIAMGARTYCQDIGRFLQPDPLFEAFARHTPYHYSFNSPLVWLDPSGLAPEKEKGEERLQSFEIDAIIFQEMEQIYRDAIHEGKSQIFVMQIRAEIWSILKTIADSYYKGNIPRTGSLMIGETYVSWTIKETETDYSVSVKLANNGFYLNYYESGTIINGKLNVTNISISTNVKQVNALGWLKRVHSGIKGSVANGEKPRHALAGITIYGNRETGETVLDVVQMGLDVAGVVDPTGICDFGGACLSFVRGDYEGAVISAAGIFGLDFLKLGKVARFGDEASGVTKLADDILEWLGEGANPYLNDAGDRYFMSFEGDRLVRFDFNNYSPHHQEHIHFIEYRIKNGIRKKYLTKEFILKNRGI